jgi:hypothetical protein
MKTARKRLSPETLTLTSVFLEECFSENPDSTKLDRLGVATTAAITDELALELGAKGRNKVVSIQSRRRRERSATRQPKPYRAERSGTETAEHSQQLDMLEYTMNAAPNDPLAEHYMAHFRRLTQTTGFLGNLRGSEFEPLESDPSRWN